MLKKMMLLAMAVGAFAAFVGPSVASAQLLTDNGTALAKGAQITATSTNLVTTTGLGDLTCANVTIHGEVIKNTGSTSEVRSTSVTTTSCDLLTTPSLIAHAATISNATGDFHIENKGVGTTTAAFTATIPAVPAQCTETGNPGITYEEEDDVIHVEGGLSSPVCGASEIHGDFTLETSNGTPVTID